MCGPIIFCDTRVVLGCLENICGLSEICCLSVIM